ncbi:MAG: VacJ family lipoprotein [Sphingomonadales bacterium]|nr:VacJ family lipoprotein [Sphingomonadales bacterium]MDE2171588.1 VacJ family lipoprotein [Sphingomonadales bacterium]
MGSRDTVSRAPGHHRILSFAMLASASMLGLTASPAMARDAAVTQAQDTQSATQATAPVAPATPGDTVTATIAVPPAPANAPTTATPAAPASDQTAAPTAPPAPQTTVTAVPAAGSNATPDAAGSEPAAETAHKETGKPGNGSDIIVSARAKAPPGDPLIGLNLKSYAAVQMADKAVVGPAAMAYKKGVPSPLRQGIHNLLLNMREPPVIVAYLVEHKIGKAFETLGRLTINTTLGIGGIFDIAKRKPFHLPWHANGMADAMGFYGIKPGPYFFLPLIGPTTLRDLIGTTIDRVGFPALYADELRSPAYGLAITIVSGLDDRVAIDPQVREFREHSPDPYAAMRRFYLARRQAEIDALHGKPPLQDKLSDYDFTPKTAPAQGQAASVVAPPPAAAPAVAPPPSLAAPATAAAPGGAPATTPPPPVSEPAKP